MTTLYYAQQYHIYNYNINYEKKENGFIGRKQKYKNKNSKIILSTPHLHHSKPRRRVTTFMIYYIHTIHDYNNIDIQSSTRNSCLKQIKQYCAIG